MQIGVNVPNFGPGTDPGVIREWARVVEGLGFDSLFLSDHVAITPDVAEQYPAPFYDPLTTLAWLAGSSCRLHLGTSVLVAPYRHPLAVARVAANLAEFTDGRLILGIGVGWATHEFAALGADFAGRGRTTDEVIVSLRAAWSDTADYRAGVIPIWVGGNSRAAVRRAVAHGDAWHPIHPVAAEADSLAAKLTAASAHADRVAPAWAPRIRLALTSEPAPAAGRLLGVGDLDQVATDLTVLEAAGASHVVLDPFDGDPAETLRPVDAWARLEAIATVRSSVSDG